MFGLDALAPVAFQDWNMLERRGVKHDGPALNSFISRMMRSRSRIFRDPSLDDRAVLTSRASDFREPHRAARLRVLDHEQPCRAEGRHPFADLRTDRTRQPAADDHRLVLHQGFRERRVIDFFFAGTQQQVLDGDGRQPGGNVSASPAMAGG